jgi:hypothetical protein
MKNTLILLLMIAATFTSSAQKMPFLQEKNEIIEEAKKELDAMIANPESDFMKKITESKISGEYVFDITIEGKGKVLSVFVVSSDADEIKQQNYVKDLVRAIQFNFKMPKDKSYKFQYTFNF